MESDRRLECETGSEINMTTAFKYIITLRILRTTTTGSKTLAVILLHLLVLLLTISLLLLILIILLLIVISTILLPYSCTNTNKYTLNAMLMIELIGVLAHRLIGGIAQGLDHGLEDLTL